MQRRDLVVVDCALFQHSKQVLTVLHLLLLPQQLAEVLRHLNDYFLDCEQDELFLVSVVRVQLALKHGFEKEAWLETRGDVIS